jgi:hypothetical protein
MPESGEDVDYADRIASQADRHKDAWGRTLDDATDLAEERAEAGWETLVIPAGHTAPENPDTGDTGRWGMAHVIPGNKADEFESLSDGNFDSYDVYRAETEGREFIVTELLDAAGELAVFVVGTYELRFADVLIETAMEEDKMHTHLQRLNGTHVASVEHEDPEKFFPNVDRFVN